MEVCESIHLMLMLLAHVMRRAGTFSLNEKIKMVHFLAYILSNTDVNMLDTGNSSGNKSEKTDHSNTPRIN
jgi:hypothetical protein